MSNPLTRKVTSPFLRVVYSSLLLVTIALLALPLVFVFMTMRTARSYQLLEDNAKKVVTAAELQSWATDFLSRPAPVNLARSNWGPNFPRPMLKLAPRLGPTLSVHEPRDTNGASHVILLWSSATLGASGFDIGPTNYVSREPKAHAWQPGVYFFKR